MLHKSDVIKHLQELRRQGKDAIVAGGWCRDYLTFRTPKDIDIFLADSVTSPLPTKLSKMRPSKTVYNYA